MLIGGTPARPELAPGNTGLCKERAVETTPIIYRFQQKFRTGFADSGKSG
jgi:hypothetical protein